MNKSELINAVAESADISKAAAGRALDAAMHAVQAALKKGDMVKKDQIIGYAAYDLDGYKPTLDLYVFNFQKNILLTKENFIPRKDKREFDYFKDGPKEPQ